MTSADRARFLRDYVSLLLAEGVADVVSRARRAAADPDHHVIQRLRALVAWFSKGLEGGSHLRAAINAADTVPQALEIIDRFFAPGVQGPGRAEPPEPRAEGLPRDGR